MSIDSTSHAGNVAVMCVIAFTFSLLRGPEISYVYGHGLLYYVVLTNTSLSSDFCFGFQIRCYF